MYPSERCGYFGLDHTRYFARRLITCPYHDGRTVIDSVRKLSYHPVAAIAAETLDFPFYSESATAILVKCEWERPLEESNFIPKRVTLPPAMEQELPVWRWSQRAEQWETMRPYLLGEPHGSRSSLFVGPDTALA